MSLASFGRRGGGDFDPDGRVTIARLQDEIARLNARIERDDSAYRGANKTIAILIKKAGGKVVITRDDIADLDPNTELVSYETDDARFDGSITISVKL